jgi:VWFA-related protein
MRHTVSISRRHRFLIGLALIALAAASVVLSARTQDGAGQPQTTFRSSVDLVYVNVIVRDQSGALVRGLKTDDFVVTEDGKAQTVSTFAYEEVGKNVAATATAAVPGLLENVGKAVAGAPALAPAPPPTAPPLPEDLHGRRLVVLFFDTSAMQPEEIGRAATAARTFVDTRLAPSDLVAVVQLSSRLDVLQDFTSDRPQLQSVLAKFDPNGSQGFEDATTADDADPSAAGAEYVPDESEFNLFNTDRRLDALGDVASGLGAIEQRKSIVYFAGGMSRTDVDNQVLLRRTIDRAVRANVAIYTMDTRGLQAFVPGGEAQQASTRGTGAFSGASMRGRFDSQMASQEALSALAKDTGGQAVFDTNDFGQVFDRVVSDTEAYYVIGYSSNNLARDGKFRRIKVQTKNGTYRVEHRSGYYAPRDFSHSSRADREQQLQDQLSTDLSVTDLPVYLSTAYFRLSASRYAVPVSIAVPGAKVPFARAGDKSRATLDLLGVVQDEQHRPVARLRDTVKLNVDDPNPSSRNIQYQTTLDLPPGRYRMKVAVRENEQGTMGAFEREVTVPALDKAPLKASAVVMGTHLGSADRSQTSPLTTLAQGLVPSVAPIVSTRQTVYFYFEVYDPQRAPAGASAGSAAAQRDLGGAAATAAAAGASDDVNVLASVSFLRKGVRVYQTPVVAVTRLSAVDRKATAFRLELPPSSLAPGLYTCQVNIIDDVAGTFAFPRLPLLVRP